MCIRQGINSPKSTKNSQCPSLFITLIFYTLSIHYDTCHCPLLFVFPDHFGCHRPVLRAGVEEVTPCDPRTRVLSTSWSNEECISDCTSANGSSILSNRTITSNDPFKPPLGLSMQPYPVVPGSNRLPASSNPCCFKASRNATRALRAVHDRTTRLYCPN